MHLLGRCTVLQVVVCDLEHDPKSISCLRSLFRLMAQMGPNVISSVNFLGKLLSLAQNCLPLVGRQILSCIQPGTISTRAELFSLWGSNGWFYFQQTLKQILYTCHLLFKYHFRIRTHHFVFEDHSNLLPPWITQSPLICQSLKN